MRLFVPLLLVLLAAPEVYADDDAPADSWPQFRGPGGQGHSAQDGLPLRWGEKKNVVWKTAIPGSGWSSPVVRGEQIWLTTATDGGKSLRAICVDRDSGEIRHNAEVFRKESPGRIHGKNG